MTNEDIITTKREGPGARRLGDSSLLPPGAVVGGYLIVELIGEGGMGRVYRAVHEQLGRAVAIKVLHTEYAHHPELVARFLNEGRLANAVKHPHVIEITDLIAKPDDHFYAMVMELLHGADLLSVIASDGPLHPLRAVHIARQLAGALAAAHRAGVVHRDLKPNNVFLNTCQCDTDCVKLLDFGVAKQHDEPPGMTRRGPTYVTAPGVVVGTPNYMAPEQGAGGDADQRSDIYALGAMMFEMITGRAPFVCDTAREAIAAHATSPPPSLREVTPPTTQLSRPLEALIHQCLEKDPKDRPQRMEEVEARLAEIEAVELSKPRRRSIRTVQAVAPRPRWSVALAVAVVALALGLGAIMAYALEDRPAPTAAEPDPPAAAPQTVTVRFDSVPAGVQVWRPGSAEPLGITPFDVALDRSSVAQAFEFCRPGAGLARGQLTPQHDLDVFVVLPAPPETGSPRLATATPCDAAADVATYQVAGASEPNQHQPTPGL